MALLLEISGVSKALYYYHLKQSPYLDKNASIVQEIENCFEDSKQTYGYRRITAVLKKKGIIVNHKKVLKIMNLLNLHPKQKKRKKYSSYQGDVGKKFDNLLNRNFKAYSPNEKWMTDVTEFKTEEGKLYLSPFIDGFNQEIVGFSISKSPSMDLILESLKNALENQQLSNADNLIIHSDQGRQYQNHIFNDAVDKIGATQSMSRKGNCNDNGLIEGFFGLMKNEMFYGKDNEFKTYDELKQEIEKYITFYNNERIKLALKACSPIQYKKQMIQINL